MEPSASPNAFSLTAPDWKEATPGTFTVFVSTVTLTLFPTVTVVAVDDGFPAVFEPW